MATILDRATGWFRKTDEPAEILTKLDTLLDRASLLEVRLNRITQTLARIEQMVMNIEAALAAAAPEGK
jgi:hypothetical protein